jgi:hypothetical protein
VELDHEVERDLLVVRRRLDGLPRTASALVDRHPGEPTPGVLLVV